MNRFQAVASLGIAATLAACGQIQPPKGATPVHFTVLTKQGALERGIFAATSLDDLRSQETLIGREPIKTCTTAGQYGCFAKFSVPPGSLLVAMQPMACADNSLDTVYLKDGALTFVINWKNSCPPGAGAAAVPADFVVAVPLSAVPKTTLPLELEFSEGGHAAEVIARGVVDLRASAPGHARSGNFTLDAAPRVVRGQVEHIAFTIFGLRAVRRYGWRVDIAAVDPAGRVAWHQTPFDDPTTFTCLVGESQTCAVGSYNVDMPTAGVPAGAYVIRPSFVVPPGLVQAPNPPLPAYSLPSLPIEVTP